MLHVIITIFFLFLFDLRFKIYGNLNIHVTVPKFFISRKAQFSVCCNYFVSCSISHAVVLTHTANATLNRSGDL